MNRMPNVTKYRQHTIYHHLPCITNSELHAIICGNSILSLIGEPLKARRLRIK